MRNEDSLPGDTTRGAPSWALRNSELMGCIEGEVPLDVPTTDQLLVKIDALFDQQDAGEARPALATLNNHAVLGRHAPREGRVRVNRLNGNNAEPGDVIFVFEPFSGAPTCAFARIFRGQEGDLHTLVADPGYRSYKSKKDIRTDDPADLLRISDILNAIISGEDMEPDVLAKASRLRPGRLWVSLRGCRPHLPEDAIDKMFRRPLVTTAGFISVVVGAAIVVGLVRESWPAEDSASANSSLSNNVEITAATGDGMLTESSLGSGVEMGGTGPQQQGVTTAATEADINNGDASDESKHREQALLLNELLATIGDPSDTVDVSDSARSAATDLLRLQRLAPLMTSSQETTLFGRPVVALTYYDLNRLVTIKALFSGGTPSKNSVISIGFVEPIQDGYLLARIVRADGTYQVTELGLAGGVENAGQQTYQEEVLDGLMAATNQIG